jgi:DNA-directed RNA polymerase alpha subunit
MQSGGSTTTGSSGDDPDLLAANGLPQWVVRSLADNGIRRASEVTALTDEQLLKLRGVGLQSVKLIRTAVGYPRQSAGEGPERTSSNTVPKDHTSGSQ